MSEPKPAQYRAISSELVGNFVQHCRHLAISRFTTNLSVLVVTLKWPWHGG